MKKALIMALILMMALTVGLCIGSRTMFTSVTVPSRSMVN